MGSFARTCSHDAWRVSQQCVQARAPSVFLCACVLGDLLVVHRAPVRACRAGRSVKGVLARKGWCATPGFVCAQHQGRGGEK